MSTTEKLPSLWEVEADLQAFIDTEEGGVPEELRAEFAQALAAKTDAAAQKRSNVLRFLAVAEHEMALCKAEEERIRTRRKQIESGLERFRAYVADIVRQHGQQKPGQKTYTLPCPTGILRAQQNAPAVVISDEQAIPLEFKKCVVTFSDAMEWKWMLSMARIADPHYTPEPGRVDVRLETMVSRIKEAQDAGVDVPGADREPQGEWSLRTK